MSNHSFDIHIATEYQSVDVAIMVWHFQYWIMKNKSLGRNCIEGRTWTYQTYIDILGHFPYWSRDQIKRLLKKCVDNGILIKRNFNKNSYDKTIWYAFNDEAKFGIAQIGKREDIDEEISGMGRKRPIEKSESPYRKIENALPIPNTLPNTLPNKDMSEHPFGRLTTFFLEKLKEINPKIKTPNLNKWSSQMAHLVRLDGRSSEEIREVIEYIVRQHQNPTSNFTWSVAVNSPEKLRKHFATIWLEIHKKTPGKAKEEIEDQKIKIFKTNYQWMKAQEKEIKIPQNSLTRVLISDNAVHLTNARGNTTVGYSEHGFKDIVGKFLKTENVI